MKLRKSMYIEEINLLKLYQETLDAEYIELEDETASYAYKVVNDELHIWFEQSNGSTDWKNNLDFFIKPYKDMQYTWRVHRGFLRVWKVIEPYLKGTILDMDITKIIISGYSHGAAIALLCYEYCVFHRPDLKDNVFGFGFGCPRVVWGHTPRPIARRFNDFYIVRNKKDLVTHLPPRLFGFRHIGNIMTIGDGHWNCIDAHRPESYIESLENASKFTYAMKNMYYCYDATEVCNAFYVTAKTVHDAEQIYYVNSGVDISNIRCDLIRSHVGRVKDSFMEIL